MNRKIPKVPANERIGFNHGFHNLPDWLLILFLIVLICYIYVVF